MNQIRKIVGFLAVMVSFMPVGAIVAFLPDRPFRRRLQIRLVQIAARAALTWCGVTIRQMSPAPWPARGFLGVSNHVSYIDVLVLASIRPFVFVTSQDLRSDPVLGTLCRLGGCEFVDRHSAKSIRKELKRLSSRMKEGFGVFVFPEGTSSDGSTILPFKAPLFIAALKHGYPIVPVAITYEGINEGPFGPDDAENVFYYGDHSFFRQLWNWAGQSALRVRIDYPPAQFAGTSSYREAADRSRRAILEKVNLVKR